MAVEVDSVIVDLEARIGQYRTDMREAISLQQQYQGGWTTAPANSNAVTQQAATVKAAARDVAQAEEQATEKVSRTRKSRADTAKQTASAEASAAKEAAAAVKAAEKEKQAAISESEKAMARAAAAEARFQQQQSKRAQARYYASGPELFEAKAKEFSAADAAREAEAARAVAEAEKEAAAIVAAAEKQKQAALAATERAMARAQAAEERFAASQTKAAEKRFYAMGPQIFEAKAREYAAAAAQPLEAPRRPLDITTGTLARSAAWEGGQNPFQNRSSGGNASAQSAEMRQTTSALAEKEAAATIAQAGAEREIDRAKLDQFDLARRVGAAEGATKVELQAQLEWLRRIETYKRLGLTEAEAQVRAEREIALLQATRAEAQATRARAGAVTGSRRGGFGPANEFALNASGGRFGYSLGAPALAGTAVFAGAAIATEAIESSTKLAEGLKKVSDQTGLSVEGLQVYQRAVEQTGGKAEQFDQALITLTENLGKAKTGSKEEAKVFDALGISIKGSVTAADILPTLIERLSSMKDPTEQAELAAKTFGGAWKDIAPALSHGMGQINDLAASLEATGQILSSSEVQKLDEVAKKVDALKASLAVDQSKIIANNADAIKGLADQFAEFADLVRDASDAYGQFMQTASGKALSTILNPTGAAVGSAMDAVDRAYNYLRGGDKKAANAPVPDGILGGEIQGGFVDEGKVRRLNAGNGRKGPKGPSPEELERQALERQKRYESQLEGYQEEQLRINQQMTGDLQEQASDQDQLSQRQRNQQLENIDLQLKENLTRKGVNQALEEQRAANLRKAVWDTEAARSAQIEDNLRVETIQQRNSIAQTRSQTAADLADSNAGQDQTATDRRRRALAQIDRQQEDERRNLQAQLDALKPGDATAKPLQERLNALPQIYDNRRQDARDQNASPFAAYVNQLPRTADQIGEAFEKAAVSGVERLNDSLATTLERMTGVHGLAGEILTDFIKIALQAAQAQIFGDGGGAGIQAGIAATVGGNYSGGGGGGFFGTLLSTAGRLFGLSGARAAGGPVLAGGTYLVGERGPELLQMGPQGGNIVPNNALGAMNPNMRAATPQVSGPVVHQTIQYQGAVDIADKAYVQQMGRILYDHTNQAVEQGSRETLAATPNYIQRYDNSKQ